VGLIITPSVHHPATTTMSSTTTSVQRWTTTRFPHPYHFYYTPQYTLAGLFD